MLRLTSLLGLFVMILIAWLLSSQRKLFPWRVVIGGLLLQFGLAFFVLYPASPGKRLFESLGSGVNGLLACVDSGASFLFNVNRRTHPAESADPLVPNLRHEDSPVDTDKIQTTEFSTLYRASLLRTFAFGVLPTVIFFSSLMSMLYHLGVMQWIVMGMAKVMQKTLAVSGAESLAAAANVFVGHTEAPLVVKPYISSMTLSEMNAMMVGGFATITGGLLAVYAGMGIDPTHLITASVISAPAALLIAKVMQPEQEESQTQGTVRIQIERTSVNVIEAAASGASEGMKLAINVGAMLIAFLALIALADMIIGQIGTWLQQDNWSLSMLLGYLFSPLAWLMGIAKEDCLAAGRLLGTKMVANEFVAYLQLSTPEIRDTLQPRTIVILTYALSGFSNFGAIGIQIGGIGGLAPDRRSDLARLGLRAMIGGALACCMTACIAGMLEVA